MHFYRVCASDCASEVESVEDHKPTKHRTEAISSLSFFFLSLFFLITSSFWCFCQSWLQSELATTSSSSRGNWGIPKPAKKCHLSSCTLRSPPGRRFLGFCFYLFYRTISLCPEISDLTKKKGKKALVHLWKKPNLKVSGEWGDANLTVQILKGD